MVAANRRVHAGSMGGLQGLVDQWRQSSYLPRVRLFGGLLLVLAGVWVVVAGPLFHRLWLDIIGAAMLVLGGYLSCLGLTGLRHAQRRPVSGRP
jgi:hypothetical protein